MAGNTGNDGQKPQEQVKPLVDPQADPSAAAHLLTMDYGSMGREADHVLPLSGGEYEGPWVSEQYPSEDTAEQDRSRTKANVLIYLCALCSSLTSVLLGYGACSGVSTRLRNFVGRLNGLDTLSLDFFSLSG